MKLRFAAPAVLIDINRIPNLDYILEADGSLRIGALVREADLEKSDVIKKKFPIVFDTAQVIADPLVRNRATICGNVAHGDKAVWKLVDQHPEWVREVPVDLPYPRDVNTWEDYQAILGVI